MIFDGYRYLRDHTSSSNVCWHCENQGQCSGRLIKKSDQIPILDARYNDIPNEQKIAQKFFIPH